MSEAASALGGAAFDGLVLVEDAGLRGMIGLRGDLTAPWMAEAVKAAVGLDLPGPLRATAEDGGEGRAVAWMSPDELLLVMPRSRVDAAQNGLRAALAGRHHLVADLSDARAVFRLSGPAPALRDTLAKLTPADMHPQALAPGAFRRTRLAQVPAAIWLREEGLAEVLCFRSVAQYVYDILRLSAEPGGEVGYFS